MESEGELGHPKKTKLWLTTSRNMAMEVGVHSPNMQVHFLIIPLFLSLSSLLLHFLQGRSTFMFAFFFSNIFWKIFKIGKNGASFLISLKFSFFFKVLGIS